MTQPDAQPPLTRPGIGVLVDPQLMLAARKSAMLERDELSELSKALELIKIAAGSGVDTSGQVDVPALRTLLTDAGITLPKRIGVSRDEIAKLESGGRKRPKITTMSKLIDTMNYARARLGKPALHIEDLSVPGEVLIPGGHKSAIDAYQEASNEIYYAAGGEQAE